MTYDEFDALAAEYWERIPDEYRAGVDGMVVERRALPHPELADVYTLGECVTESFPSDWGGPDTTRSIIVLYYGSFLRLSRIDPEFHWQDELWETLTHELQHHLESLAAEDTLEDLDYAADHNFRRYADEPFDPWFFRQGIPDAGGYRVERELFVELPWAAELRFRFNGHDYVVEPPAPDADIMLLAVVDGVPDAEGALTLAITRPLSLGGRLRRLLAGGTATVSAHDVAARPL